MAIVIKQVLNVVEGTCSSGIFIINSSIFFKTLFFYSSFRFIVKLRERYRALPHILKQVNGRRPHIVFQINTLLLHFNKYFTWPGTIHAIFTYYILDPVLDDGIKCNFLLFLSYSYMFSLVLIYTYDKFSF